MTKAKPLSKRAIRKQYREEILGYKPAIPSAPARPALVIPAQLPDEVKESRPPRVTHSAPLGEEGCSGESEGLMHTTNLSYLTREKPLYDPNPEYPNASYDVVYEVCRQQVDDEIDPLIDRRAFAAGAQYATATSEPGKRECKP